MAVDVQAPEIRQNVRWGERYVSSALNKKLAGIVPSGIYHGFRLRPGGIMRVFVDHDADYARSVAIVERDGYSLTIVMEDSGYVAIPASGTWYIVIEAFYIETQPGYQRIVAREKPEPHHIILGKVTVNGTNVNITPQMIDENCRQEGNDITNAALDHISTVVEALRGHKEAVWTISNAIEINGVLSLPTGIKYAVGQHLVSLNWDGLECYPGSQFEEIGVAGQESASLKMLFPVPAGSEFHVRISPYSLEDSLPESKEFHNLLAKVAWLEQEIVGLSKDVAYVEGKE